MTRLPGALFVVDIKREHIAIKEAQKLKIPIFAMVDTNSDPREVNYVIPANDDATKSIDKILTIVVDAIGEGLKERKTKKKPKNKKNRLKKKLKLMLALKQKKLTNRLMNLIQKLCLG